MEGTPTEEGNKGEVEELDFIYNTIFKNYITFKCVCCACVCACVCMMTYVFRESGVNLWEVVLSFCHVRSEAGTQASSFGSCFFTL